MNRIKIVASAAILSLSLAGCQTLPDTAGVIDRIKAATVAACNFLPTAEFVAELLLKNWEGLDKISAIANAICDSWAVPAPLVRSSAPVIPTVRGITVEGYFVNQ